MYLRKDSVVTELTAFGTYQVLDDKLGKPIKKRNWWIDKVNKYIIKNRNEWDKNIIENKLIITKFWF